LIDFSFARVTIENRKVLMKKIISFLFEESPTSFGDNVYRARWFSVLCDYACLFTLGFYKPKRGKDERSIHEFN